MNNKNNEDWIDDLGQLLTIFLPVVILFIGIFGEQIADLTPEMRSSLISSGLLATGISGSRKNGIHKGDSQHDKQK